MRTVLFQFFVVCDQYLTFRLPWIVPEQFRDPSFLPLRRGLLPLFGTMIALLVCIPFQAFAALTKPLVGMIAALLLPLLLDVYTGFHPHAALAEYVVERKNACSQADALSEHELFRFGQVLNYPGTYGSIMLLRMVLCAVLVFNGYLFGAAIAIIASWFARAEVSMARMAGGNEFIPAPSRYKSLHRLSGSLLILLCALPFHAVFISLTAFLIAWGIATYAIHLCAEESAGMNRRIFDLTGAVTEIILLLFAVLVLVH